MSFLGNINLRSIGSIFLLSLIIAVAGCTDIQAEETSRLWPISSLEGAALSPKSNSATTLSGILPGAAIGFSLPNISRTPSQLWRSQDLLGESLLLLLILGATPNHSSSKTESTPAIIHHNLSFALRQALFETDGFSSSLVLVASDQSLVRRFGLGKPLSTGDAMRSIPRLWDAKSTLRQQFKLQERFGITPAQSALVSIDRAGWLRSVSKVETAGQQRSALKVAENMTPELAAGKPAPDFALPDMNGVLRSPAEFKGRKYLLLTFFPKCFTGTCTKQLSSLRDSSPDLEANDIAVWGVSVDPSEGEKGQRAFAQFLELPFPLLPDTGRHLSILYGAAQSPNQTSSRISVLIDKSGVVRWIDKQINPTTHGADVVAKVHELELSP